MFFSTCAHHQEVKIALHSIWYHHIYRCDDTRGCVMQFWPPDDKHMCSKHVEAWNKLIVKHKFCASSWLNPEINILRCTVSKTSKLLSKLVFLSHVSDKQTLIILFACLLVVKLEYLFSTRSPFVTLLSDALSLVGDPLPGNGCGSPNHI